MLFLKADTAVKVVIGPAVAVGDGFTPVITLVITGGGAADEAELMKHDAAAIVDISGRTFAAITTADGYYNLSLSTADTDTEGMLTVLINDDSLILPLRHDFMVVAANVYDSLFAVAGTDRLEVDVLELVALESAAIGLALSANAVVSGACEGTPTVTDIQTDLADSGNDVYIGRILIITSGAAIREMTEITDYVGATGTLIVNDLAVAPANTDTFIIL